MKKGRCLVTFKFQCIPGPPTTNYFKTIPLGPMQVFVSGMQLASAFRVMSHTKMEAHFFKFDIINSLGIETSNLIRDLDRNKLAGVKQPVLSEKLVIV